MKLSIRLAITVLFLGTPLIAQEENSSFLTRAKYFGKGAGALSLSLTQIGSACVIGYFVHSNVSAEKLEPDYATDASKRFLCRLAYLLGFVSTGTLLYHGWKIGDYSVQQLKKAFPKEKNDQPANSKDTVVVPEVVVTATNDGTQGATEVITSTSAELESAKAPFVVTTSTVVTPASDANAQPTTPDTVA